MKTKPKRKTTCDLFHKLRNNVVFLFHVFHFVKNTNTNTNTNTNNNKHQKHQKGGVSFF